MLRIVADLDLNLTKLESRPILSQPFEYTFHIDLESRSEQTELLNEAIARISKHSIDVRILGLYQSAKNIGIQPGPF